MLERLEAAYAAQRRFVHDASHELRTPLTIARGHLEVLVLDPDPPAEETGAASRWWLPRSSASAGW